MLEGGGDASQTCVQDPMTVNRLATSEELHPNLNPPQLSRPICSQSITAMPTEETANIVSRSVHGPSGPFSESDLRDVPGDGGPAALTPEDSDTDREEATINLTDVGCAHEPVLPIWAHLCKHGADVSYRLTGSTMVGSLPLVLLL